MATTVTLPRAIGAKSGARLGLRLWPEWLTLLAYTSLVAFAIPFHEPWADEAQAWQLIRNVPLVDLFTNYLRHEGHPSLWYLLLYAINKCHFSYTGMHWIIGVIATAAAAILIFCSPFPRLARLTLPFTFFLAFQYAIVARSYVLIPLLLFSAAVVWRDQNALKPALALGLLANVSLHATAVSVGFAIVYHLQLRDDSRTVRYRKAAYGLSLVLLTVAVLTVLPQPKDLLGPSLPDYLSPAMNAFLWALRSVIYLSRGLISFPWICGVAALGGLLWATRKALPFRYLLPLLFLAIFSGYYFTFWHLGVVAPTCIAVAWIAWPIQIPSRSAKLIAQVVIFVAITMQSAYTAYAVIYDHYFPYSPDLAASQFLLPRVKAGTPMAVTYVKNIAAGSFFSVGLRPYIPGPIFLNEPEPFWKWTNTEHSRAQFASVLKTHPPLVVVEYYDVDARPFNPKREIHSRTLTLLAHEGYVLTHTFCAAKPEDLREREYNCHLIFELSSGLAQSGSFAAEASKEKVR